MELHAEVPQFYYEVRTIDELAVCVGGDLDFHKSTLLSL